MENINLDIWLLIKQIGILILITILCFRIIKYVLDDIIGGIIHGLINWFRNLPNKLWKKRGGVKND